MTNGEKFNQAIKKILIKNGAFTEPYGFYKWSIITIYGKLRISLDKPKKRQKLFKVFCRFEFPSRVPATLSNPYSGKRHFKNSDMGKCIKQFDLTLGSILMEAKTLIEKGICNSLAEARRMLKSMPESKLNELVKKTSLKIKSENGDIKIQISYNCWLCFQDTETNQKGTEYVRFEDCFGKEVLYFDSNEWVESPQEVMGVIMSAILIGAQEKSI